ncbi:hypothetical protein DVH05_028608 [Phytophthora capsici]|nr:hypothetical protein DVH05_028608 [Phytophthora capsici]
MIACYALLTDNRRIVEFPCAHNKTLACAYAEKYKSRGKGKRPSSRSKIHTVRCEVRTTLFSRCASLLPNFSTTILFLGKNTNNTRRGSTGLSNISKLRFRNYTVYLGCKALCIYLPAHT